jgi:diketogulonate reductase-like aldo/keto reductase
LNPLKDNLTRQSANIPLIDTWRELETLYKRGIVRSIGVSNVSLEQLKELVSQCEIKPHNLQVYLICGVF